MLRQAKSRGILEVPVHRRRFEADRAFERLRSRQDFQSLLADLIFPVLPFDR
jgi:hypothetical protein